MPLHNRRAHNLLKPVPARQVDVMEAITLRGERAAHSMLVHIYIVEGTVPNREGVETVRWLVSVKLATQVGESARVAQRNGEDRARTAARSCIVTRGRAVWAADVVVPTGSSTQDKAGCVWAGMTAARRPRRDPTLD